MNIEDLSNVTVNITAESLQNYLQNVVISTIALNMPEHLLWKSPPITILNGTNVYTFDTPAQFYGPYAACLVATLIIYVVGLVSLEMNGVSAGNSFLQYVCTTRISQTLQNLGERCTFGGQEDIVRELRDVPLLFGIKNRCPDEPDNERGDMAGFGTFGEVESFPH